ncbi:DUF3152 domain-containing protein [Corynebacterium sp. UMB10321]|uniref:DUF3152 domain-containing protein n=1 Tax=Corynebacterium sp. UMB10321 TaxID=3046312 RepID=UPI00254DA5B6|nr:DUF3152 domain-containing protein [Corynebacterium sp. UMB10321]MDK8243407.1 DUF3152 domain-containing protein [Corynebacterium sp. UMB10321]
MKNNHDTDVFEDWDFEDDGEFTAVDPEAEGRLVRFAREYGWRAYAIPVLAVLTVFVIVNMLQNPDGEVFAGSAGDSAVEQPDGDEASRTVSVLPEGQQDVLQLPPGGPFTETGEGTFYEVGHPGMQAGKGDELTVRFVVEVEHGLDTALYGGNEAVAALVDATLSDPRGWTNDPRFRFEHVTAADEPSLRIRLASAATTRELCGVHLEMETSCRTRVTGEDTVILNEARWVRGAAPYEGDLGRYRQYLINHEVGHALGFAHHEPCPENGVLAPVMMQQTLSLNNAQLYSFDKEEVYPDNQDTCRSNPWPYPRPAVL